ncbi:hypothetical protein ACG9XW_08480 [Acinetobacter guillouiae]|uniref:hypothetical protein n=1 Tax=Acinetobacter guillouiae TaxID=106649 RepID=UPI003AF9AF4A
MTTINNSENLIEKVGGIEKAREIVNGAPEWATTYCMAYAAYGATFHWYGACKNCYELPDLRTAIAQHDSREFKVGDLVVLDHPLTRDRLIQFPPDGSLLSLAIKNGDWSCRHATPSEIKAGHRLEAERHG